MRYSTETHTQTYTLTLSGTLAHTHRKQTHTHKQKETMKPMREQAFFFKKDTHISIHFSPPFVFLFISLAVESYYSGVQDPNRVLAEVMSPL